uniref:FliG_C domain-containing protein n=2 Tax=Steinernema glaseri TaxID=37863 RepID=A0A1I7ZNM0_9BILA
MVSLYFAVVFSVFVGLSMAEEDAQLKLLTYLMPTVSQNFIMGLTSEEAKAVEQAGKDASDIRAQGKPLSDDEETALVKKYSPTAYSKTVKYEAEFLDILKSMSPNVRTALDKVMGDRSNSDLGNLNISEWNKYLINIANAFKDLTEKERQELEEVFPNYGALLKNPDFEHLMRAEPEKQAEVAELFFSNLEKS